MENLKIKSDEELIKDFKENDYICHINTYQVFPMWFHATDSDVEKYSGKNGYYIRKK